MKFCVTGTEDRWPGHKGLEPFTSYVTVDGTVFRGSQAGDTEAGWVTGCVLDADGCAVFDEENDEFVEETRHGVVEIHPGRIPP